jgi:nucleolar pre-ribosomal-associated protein 1
MYGKVNKYLQKRPSWEIEKIPSYWIDRVVLHEPENDDGYLEEVNWLLDLLVNGLRTAQVRRHESRIRYSLKIYAKLIQDLEIYRRANVFEHILSLYNTSTLNKSVKSKILHLLFRATQVGGGTTLITRAAVMSWMESRIAASDSETTLLANLARAAYDTSDKARVDAWSGHAVSQAVDRIAG